MIEARSLNLSLGGAAVLNGISLDVTPGGITAILGPNGAGKSSLMHVLAGLTRPDGGEVRIDGIAIHQAAARQRARIVALMQQSPRIMARITVADLIGFGRWPQHGGRPGPDDRAAVEAAIDRFDLGPLRHRLLDTLSGGQRQRALIAMAYAQSTPWLFLDEPLNGLDPRYGRDLMHLMHDLSRPGAADARSVVVVLHDLNAAAAWADRAILLSGGALVAHGPTRDTLTADRLEQVFDIPFETLTHSDRLLIVAR